MIRRAKAVWRGTGRAGSGSFSTDFAYSQTPRILSRLASRTRRAPILRS